MPIRARRSVSRVTRLLAAAAIIAGGCADGDSLPTPPDTTQAAEVLRRSLLVTVDLEHGTLQGALVPPGGSGSQAGDRPHVILGTNELGVTLTNLVQSAAGQYQPGKVRVTFDVALTNRLNSTTFVTPTFPRPPAGQAGLLLFPFQATTTPARLAIKPSPEWNGDGSAGSGAPWNFLGNATCFWGRECYRWEAYPTPLAPKQTTSPRTVGFDVDKRATSFTAYLVLAADLQDSPPTPGNGGLAGTVTSLQRGPLAGVSVSGAGATTATDGAGLFTLANLAPGATTLALSSLPTGCTDPGSLNATVVSGGVATVNFSVTCTAPPSEPGGLHGVITGLPLLGPVADGEVKLVADGSVDTLRFRTGATGEYLAPGLAPGRYAVAFTGPPICHAITGTRIVIVAGVDLALDLGVDCPDGMIQGTVKSSRGLPVPNVTVELSVGGGFLAVVADSTGFYQTGALRPEDTYGVLPRAKGTCAPIGIPVPVFVPSGRRTTFNMEMDCNQGAVTGTVSGPSGFGPATGRVALQGGPGNISRFVSTDDAGNYIFEAVPPTSILAPYAVSLVEVPIECSVPAPGVGIPKAGQTDVVNFSVACSKVIILLRLRDARTGAPVDDPGIGITAANDYGDQITFNYSVTPSAERVWEGIGYMSVPYTYRLTNLPANCDDPGPRRITAWNGTTLDVLINLVCH